MPEKEPCLQLADLPGASSIFLMRHQPGKPPSLTGQLLVAHPNMLDPNFRRSVLLISSHNFEEGAEGLIINRPLDKQVWVLDLLKQEKSV